MKLYIAAKTDIKDLFIDFIAVHLKSGEEVSIDWYWSRIRRTDDGFVAECGDVLFDQELALGKLQELENMEVVDMGLYSMKRGEGVFNILLEELEFQEDGKSLVFQNAFKFELPQGNSHK